MTEITDNREIFTNVIRELIWNSNDALEEVRNKSSTYSSKSIKDLKITIELNKQTNTLTITDTGEGMEEDVLRNLGSITKYNKRCAKKFPQSDISKFSVCFYFAYLIADKVVVKTKHNDDKGYILEAESNTVTPNSGIVESVKYLQITKKTHKLNLLNHTVFIYINAFALSMSAMTFLISLHLFYVLKVYYWVKIVLLK